MPESRVLGVIPARLGSERLPRKPLHVLAGRPLIEWVWRRAAAFGVLDTLVVATDSEEVATVVAGFGGRVVLTSAEHLSGTDRVAEVVRTLGGDFGVVVNIQGDEPFLREEQVRSAVGLVQAGWPVGTLATPVGSLEAWQDPSVVKVVRRADGAALYFSRAPIPHRRQSLPTLEQLRGVGYLRHIGLYAYAPAALEQWVKLPEGELERIEKLEQLRPLAAGMNIGVAVVDHAPEGVDTPGDAERAEKILIELAEAEAKAD